MKAVQTTASSRSRADATAAGKEKRPRPLSESNVLIETRSAKSQKTAANAKRGPSSSAAAPVEDLMNATGRVSVSSATSSSSSLSSSSNSSSSISRNASGSGRLVFKVGATIEQKNQMRGRARKEVAEMLREVKFGNGTEGMKKLLLQLQERLLWVEKVIDENGDVAAAAALLKPATASAQAGVPAVVHAKELATLQAQIDELRAQVDAAEEETDTARNQLSAAQASQVQLQSRHESEIARMKAAHAKALEDVKAKAAAATAAASEHAGALQAAKASQDRAVAAVEARAKRELDALRTAHARETGELQASFEAASEDLRERLAGRESEVVKLTAALTESRAQALKTQASLEAVVAARQADVDARAAAESAMSSYKARFDVVDSQRAVLLEQVCALQGRIRVMVRVRPPLEGEPSEPSLPPLCQFPDASEDGSQMELVEKPSHGIGGYGQAAEGKRHGFKFQRVFPPTAGQADVFEQVQGLVQSALDGHRVTVFSYGQTGSGKTHTMFGPPSAPSSSASAAAAARVAEDDRGIVPRAVDLIFTRIGLLAERGWASRVEVEMVEIYNEVLRDLMPSHAGAGKTGKGASSSSSSSSSNSGPAPALDIHHDKDGNTRVAGLSSHAVSSAGQLEALMARAVSSRATASTASNSTSSRSHCVFTLRVELQHPPSGVVRRGVLNLVDLAGSERLSKSGAEGDRKKETAAINTSLSTLAKVIMSLQQHTSHVPFRDSKLTYLLQNSLGGSAKTVLLANVNPLHANSHESLCTLRFAESVAQVTTKPAAPAGAAGASKA